MDENLAPEVTVMKPHRGVPSLATIIS